MANITLTRLADDDREQFILDNQRAFRYGTLLLVGFLVVSLVSGAFAVLNVFDDKSYVIASAVSELYVLTMMSLIGYLTYYLAYRKAKTEQFLTYV